VECQLLQRYATDVELTNDYVKIREQYSGTPTPQLNNRIVQLKAQLDLVKDDFSTLEGNLSRLENRQPRQIAINFVPPEPPTGLQAVVH